MAQITIHRPEESTGKPAESFLHKIGGAFEAVRRRAFEHFENRGRQPGFELDDWFRAERDLLWVPWAEISETNEAFNMKVDVQGFETSEISVSALPGEIMVHADAERYEANEFETKSLFRKFETRAIDVNRVIATIDKGMLTIVAPKVVAKPVLVEKEGVSGASPEKKSGDSVRVQSVAA